LKQPKHYENWLHSPNARFQTTYEELKPWLGLRWVGQQIGFQTTYEELKRNGEFVVNAKSTGFQTTYEELKPRRQFLSNSQRNRFQTTYEELKQDMLKYLDGTNNAASRLPMRN